MTCRISHFSYIFNCSCVFPMIISGDKHKCQNEDCNADRRSAPLYVFIQMQLCQRESLKDWLKANQDRNHVFCLTVFEQVVENLCLHGNSRYITCKQIQSILKSFELAFVYSFIDNGIMRSSRHRDKYVTSFNFFMSLKVINLH